MPTLAEQIAATDAKLDLMIASGGTAPASSEPTTEVTVTEALDMINAELQKKDAITKERAAYLRTVLAEITKALNFEDLPALELPFTIKVSDPAADKVHPTTATGTVQNPPVPADILPQQRTTMNAANLPPQAVATNFSSNLAKAEAIQKTLLAGPSEIRKSKYSDKLDEIKDMFGITEDDLKGDEYQLRWKLGDLLKILQDAVKLERLTGSVETEKAAGPQLWPSDMASATFDEKAGVFKNDPGKWADKQA